MARKRTQEQRAEIVRRCCEIEAKGGDVLAFLAGEGYVTPRATWINIQRCDLNRKEYTDGRPDSKVRKSPTGRIKRTMEEIEEIHQHIFEIMADGGNPDEYIISKGYLSPVGFKATLMQRWKKKAPEKYAAVMAAKQRKRKPAVTNAAEMQKPVTEINFRFVPLREIRKQLREEQTRIGVSDFRRCLEIEEDLRCIERVRQLGLEALRRAGA